MSDITFVPFTTVIPSTWAQDINNVAYRVLGTGGVVPASTTDVITNLGLNSTVNALLGASLIGYNPALSYSVNTVGARLNDLSNSTDGTKGSNLVGYLPAGAGTVSRTVELKLRDIPSVPDFGGAFDGVTDDTAAVQRAVTALAVAGGGFVALPPGKPVSIQGTVHIPAGVKLNLNGCTITGTGVGGNTVFDTGYLSGGAVITNIGTPAESHRVIEAEVFGGTIQNCGYAFNLFNFNEHSSIHDIEFSNCTYAVNSSRPWYSSYRRLMSRNSAGGATNAAYSFDSFVNIVEIEQVSAINRVLGFKFSLGCYALILKNCSAETCTAGMLFTDTVHALSFQGRNYFENVTNRALEFSGGGSSFIGIDIDGCWFNLCGTAAYGINFMGRWGRQNRRNSGTCTVDFSDSASSVVFEQQRAYTATNITTPGLEANVSLSGRCIVSCDDTLFNNGSGLPTVRSSNFGGTKVPLTLWGDPGEPDSGVIPFCTNVSSSPGSTPFSVLVNTKITVQAHGMSLFSITVSDNTGSYLMSGVVFGTTVKQFDSSTKTVTAANVGGLLQLTLGAGNQFSHPTGVYTATGTVRIV